MTTLQHFPLVQENFGDNGPLTTKQSLKLKESEKKFVLHTLFLELLFKWIQ